MPNKTPAVVSTILTILLLFVFAVLSIFTQLIAFNGVSESQGMTAMGISLACQGAGIILIGIFVWWLTHRLISKYNWNKIVAVIVAVFLGTVLGAGISFLSIIIAVPVAGIR